MSGHNAPSPAPRSASTGPNGPLTTPGAAPLVNGVTNGAVAVPTGPTASAATGSAAGGMSQQNLNQIVSTVLLLSALVLVSTGECVRYEVMLAFFVFAQFQRFGLVTISYKAAQRYILLPVVNGIFSGTEALVPSRLEKASWDCVFCSWRRRPQLLHAAL
jgi:hypothetical protein